MGFPYLYYIVYATVPNGTSLAQNDLIVFDVELRCHLLASSCIYQSWLVHSSHAPLVDDFIDSVAMGIGPTWGSNGPQNGWLILVLNHPNLGIQWF
jgi:hypothetical protein